NEVKFNKHIRNLVEILSTNIGMPTRSEMDSVYKEIERIKNKLKEMSDNIRDMSKIRKETARVSR
ncbi:MAG: poly(R)-hydroxyalkanoic acid synthase subunit PhaE, partial [Nitrososphaerales archaeon]